MFKVLTSSGIISEHQDTGIEDIELAKDRARIYFAQGYDAEVRDEDTEESIFLLMHDED